MRKFEIFADTMIIAGLLMVTALVLYLIAADGL